MSLEYEDYIFGLGIERRLIVSSVMFPVECAKVQIHVSENPVYGIRNIVKQLKQTYQLFGLRGCFTGYIPWISTNICYMYALDITKQALSSVIENVAVNEQTEYKKLTLFVNNLGQGIVCRTVAVVVSQPLYVVTTRIIAQLVTHETKYKEMISALFMTMQEEGFGGLFAGLLPRLIADIAVYTVASMTMYVAHHYVVKTREVQKVVDASILCATRATFYNLTVVSSRMAVSNSGLTVGSPPNMPHYENLYDCLNHLDCLSRNK